MKTVFVKLDLALPDNPECLLTQNTREPYSPQWKLFFKSFNLSDTSSVKTSLSTSNHRAGVEPSASSG